MMPGIGPMELIVVLVIALIILGPKKLPDMGRSVGKGMREFKSAISGDGDDDAGKRLTASTSAKTHDEYDHEPEPAEAPRGAAPA
jgi:sec-independent protein translocase protein TatA